MYRRINIFVSVILLITMQGCASPVPYPELVDARLVQPVVDKDIGVVLVLSAGGTKSLAHVGVLKVLKENNIPIDMIVGASSGAVVGAMYADGLDPDRIKAKLISLKQSDIMNLSVNNSAYAFWHVGGVYNADRLKDLLENFIEADDFEQLQIPLVVVTTDIDKNKPFIIQSGKLAPALLASSAMPFIFSPINIYGKTLVDGGVISPVPVEIAKRFNPKVIIAVNVGAPPDEGMVVSTSSLVYKSAHIMYYTLANWQTSMADVVIEPNMLGVGMFDDDKNEKLYQEGIDAALKAIPQIMAKLNQKIKTRG